MLALCVLTGYPYALHLHGCHFGRAVPFDAVNSTKATLVACARTPRRHAIRCTPSAEQVANVKFHLRHKQTRCDADNLNANGSMASSQSLAEK